MKTSKISALTMSLPVIKTGNSFTIDKSQASQLLQLSYEQGVRNYQMAPHYLNGQCEPFVGDFFKDIRSELSYSTTFCFYDPKLPKTNPVRFGLMNSLENLKTDYIDCLYFYSNCLTQSYIDEAKSLKEEGLAKHIGVILDPHYIKNTEDILSYMPLVDTILVYFIPTMPEQMNLLKKLKENGIKIVAAGLANIDGPITPDITLSIEQASTTEIATRYFLKQDIFEQVTVLLDHGAYLNLVRDCELSNDNYEISKLSPYFERSRPITECLNIICSGCGYCTPCPNGIDIPRLFNMYAYFDQYGMYTRSIKEFKKYCDEDLKNRIENACVKCGICEKRCPQRTPIISKLNELEGFMDKLIKN